MSEKQVKVWNDNVHPYRERFQSEHIEIAPGDYHEMDYDKAVLFLGTYTPIKIKGDNTHDPISFKKLRIDNKDREAVLQSRLHPSDKAADKEKVFVCMACSKEFLTKKGLEKHTKDKHLDDIKDKDARNEMIDREDI